MKEINVATFTSNNNDPAVVAENTSDAGDAIRAVGGVGVRAITQKAGGVAVIAQGGANNQCLFATSVGGQVASFVSGSNFSPSAPPCVDINGGGATGLRVQSAGSFGVDAFGATAGVQGKSAKNGVVGVTASDTDAGVNGGNTGKGFGVFGGTVDGHGVEGHSTNGIGVVGFSERGLAGRFIGNVEVTGNLSTPKGTVTCFDIGLVGADCAEEFDVAGAEVAEPGSVMSLDENGTLRRSRHAYDRNVAGVISGAGDYRPGVVLDQQVGCGNRAPLALMGKVYCLADAQYGAIGIGDLLTSSPTPGHAMRVADFGRAFGAVIGKAMRPLAEGRGLLPVLIALR